MNDVSPAPSYQGNAEKANPRLVQFIDRAHRQHEELSESIHALEELADRLFGSVLETHSNDEKAEIAPVDLLSRLSESQAIYDRLLRRIGHVRERLSQLA